jgi:STE24 endopeptidase
MTSNIYEKTFWAIIATWYALYLLLAYLQHQGNSCPLALQQVLAHFNYSHIINGKSYSGFALVPRVVIGLASMAVLVLSLRLGYWQKLFTALTRLLGDRTPLGSLTFALIFLLTTKVLAFPTSYIFGHLREKAFGFSQLSLLDWLVRYAKTLTVSLSIELLAVAAIALILYKLPQHWHLALPVTLGGLAFLLINLSPFIITPIFYNQRPLEASPLKSRLLEIAKNAGLEVNEAYVIDESRYSTHTNAYFSGIGPFKQIVLYDNLIKQHTEEEVCLIFAHEAGHWKHNHMAWGLLSGFLGALLVCLLIKAIYPNLVPVGWFGLAPRPNIQALPFFFILYLACSLIFAPIESQISQHMEKQADGFSLEITGLKEAYISSQIRLSELNRSDLLPHKFRVFWLYSHPTALERINAAK